MDWLNYHHLLYFWTVAREGSLAAAGRKLRLAPPTLSTQIHALEDALGEKLFVREGRRLIPTETGQVVLRYADEIFGLGQELLEVLRGRPTGRPLRLVVGVADALPKLIIRRLMEPVWRLSEPLQAVFREGKPEALLADLASHAIDLVLSDAPVPAGAAIKAFNHLLGESATSLFGSKELVTRYARGFPRSLDGAPMILPTDNTPLRRALEQWFDRVGIRPEVVAECEDSALLKSLGREGMGFFPGPAAVRSAIERQYEVRQLARIEEVRERFYAITLERRLRNPAIVAISEGAKADVFREPE